MYPKILTNKDWQSKKGKIAKIAGETGVGDLMVKAEALYKKVDWTVFDAKQSQVIPPQPTVEEVNQGLKAAKAEYSTKVEPLRKALAALRDRAKEIAGKWKKTKLIPSSSTKHATEVAAEADRFFTELKSLDAHFKTFDEVLGEIAKREKIAREMLAGWIKKVKEGCKAVAADPTPKTYNDKLYQKVRGLGTAIGSIPEHKKKWTPVWGNAGFSKGIKLDMDAEALKTRVKQIAQALQKFEQEIK